MSILLITFVLQSVVVVCGHACQSSLGVSDIYLFSSPSFVQCPSVLQRLKDGDLVEFGGNRLVKFHLRRRPLVVTVSAISDAAKDALVSAVAKLGGESHHRHNSSNQMMLSLYHL